MNVWRNFAAEESMGAHTDPRPLYDLDFYAWTQEQARELRALAEIGSNTQIDLRNVAEEIESMGKSQLRALQSALAVILEHLLKLEFSPAEAPRAGWKLSVRRARLAAEEIIEENPSLGSAENLTPAFAKAWRRGYVGASAALEAYGEKSAATSVPSECPYDLDQVRDPSWFPVNRHGLAG